MQSSVSNSTYVNWTFRFFCTNIFLGWTFLNCFSCFHFLFCASEIFIHRTSYYVIGKILVFQLTLFTFGSWITSWSNNPLLSLSKSYEASHVLRILFNITKWQFRVKWNLTRHLDSHLSIFYKHIDYALPLKSNYLCRLNFRIKTNDRYQFKIETIWNLIHSSATCTDKWRSMDYFCFYYIKYVDEVIWKRLLTRSHLAIEPFIWFTTWKPQYQYD